MPSCRQCQSPFEITSDDLNFYDKVSPVFGGQKFLIPPPVLCPNCRLQRRLNFRHGGGLYNRQSSLSGKDIISMFPPNLTLTVYDQTEWWSDVWDGSNYGRDYDFSKTATINRKSYVYLLKLLAYRTSDDGL